MFKYVASQKKAMNFSCLRFGLNLGDARNTWAALGISKDMVVCRTPVLNAFASTWTLLNASSCGKWCCCHSIINFSYLIGVSHADKLSQTSSLTNSGGVLVQKGRVYNTLVGNTASTVTFLGLENLLKYVAGGRKEDYNSLVCDKGKFQFNGNAVKALIYFSQQLHFAFQVLACSSGCCGGFLL